MAVYLFTDFGAADIYVGQVKSALRQYAPALPVFDLLHEAPPFNIRAGAHLLAALAAQVPAGGVIFSVIDPGVGSARPAVAVRADGRWYVGPDNGLLSVMAARAATAAVFDVIWHPNVLSDSFHGRDWFAPVAAFIADGRADTAVAPALRDLQVKLAADDLHEIIYIDHYGNALTGIRHGNLERSQGLLVANQRIAYARVFDEAVRGEVFWYENSIGLLEIAANQGNASALLNLRVGQKVAALPS